jgi:hypothetical protein
VNWADWAAGFCLLALVYLVVKPNSVAADFIAQFTSALTTLVVTATDLGGTK